MKITINGIDYESEDPVALEMAKDLRDYVRDEAVSGESKFASEMKRVGRPEKPEDDVRKNIFKIRLSEFERAVIEAGADKDGEKPSSWARRILVRSGFVAWAFTSDPNQAVKS